jgi:hypothetical protein
MDVISGEPVPAPPPVELIPEDAWNQFRRACGVGCAPVSDAIDWFTDMYDLPAARDPLVFDDEMMGRRLLDLEADLRRTRDVVAQLRREASDEIWLVALQRDEARAELADVHRHVADLDTQLAAARRQCEWYRAMVRSLRKSATAWLKEIALEFSNG